MGGEFRNKIKVSSALAPLCVASHCGVELFIVGAVVCRRKLEYRDTGFARLGGASP